MEMEECQNIDLEFEADGLIDDKQFSENSLGCNTYELAGELSTKKEVHNSLGITETEHLPELHESTEPERNQKNGRYNLRKSLAWDSAFFTSAGVLDAEELSTMITGADQSEKHVLPGIQEDITESTESFSTLGSDALTLDTLEDDLFEDIRASIQRSSKKTSNLRSSNNKTAAMEVDSTAISSLKKEKGLVSQNNIPKSGLKKTSSLPTVGMSKCQPKQNTGKLGSGKATKQDTVHSQTSVGKIGGTDSILPKPPKNINSSIPSSAAVGKRDSIGISRPKSASGISNPGATATLSSKRTQPLKASSLGNARKALPKPATSSNSSLLASSNTSTGHSTRSSTSSDSSSNTSSRINPGKPNLMMARRNPGKSSSVGAGPAGSIPKTPSRATLKKNLPSSTVSAHLMSSKISSSVSPASSISEWSSVSSSSSSMINQKSSRTSVDTSSCRSIEGDSSPLDQRNRSADRNADGHENQGVISTSNNSKKSSTQTGGNLHAPAKPSGLRMPSHKFGFFDGVKSSARTPNGHQQSPSAVQNGLPKNGPATGIPIRSSINKPKSAKTPTARVMTSSPSIKPSSPRATTPASSVREKKSTALANASIVSKNVMSFPSLSIGVEGKETCQEAEKVPAQDGVIKQVIKNTIDESLGDLPIKKDCNPICQATDKENGHDKYIVEGLIGDDKSSYQNVNGSVNELLRDTSPCRAPFTLKNSFCSNECADTPKESAIQVADKMDFLLPSSEQKENS